MVMWLFCQQIWDTGRGLSLKSMYSTGYAVISLSVLLALGLAMW